MITVKIRYRSKRNVMLEYKSLALALEKVRDMLDIGDSYKMYEGDVLLASGKIEDYKE
jgi:hypothetical protein